MDLIQLAAERGYAVEYLSLAKHSGLLLPDKRILIKRHKSALTQRAALAHELGHAHYGHDWRHIHSRGRDEHRANLYAANLLIDAKSYAVAEVMYDSEIDIAAELEVPVKLLRIWQAAHDPCRSTHSHLEGMTL